MKRGALLRRLRDRDQAPADRDQRTLLANATPADKPKQNSEPEEGDVGDVAAPLELDPYSGGLDPYAFDRRGRQ